MQQHWMNSIVQNIKPNYVDNMELRILQHYIVLNLTRETIVEDKEKNVDAFTRYSKTDEQI